MKIDINDPRITAFALGELTSSEAGEIARAVRSDSRIREAVDNVRETAAFLQGTLGDEPVHLLTAEQRAAVRSAGEDFTVTNISEVKIPFWRHPVVVGMGAAAAVVFGVFLINQSGSKTPAVSNVEPGWNWGEVGIEDLTAPATLNNKITDESVSHSSAQATAVASAISEDTTSFRKEVERRIEKHDLNSLPLPSKINEQDWKSLDKGDSLSINVPLASGATTWPLLERYLTETSSLPPHSAVRIEEMVNHFIYKAPTMLQSGGLVADMECCNTPWNPNTMLLAVHVRLATSAAHDTEASLIFSGEQVKRVRILGYSGISGNRAKSAPSHISKSHGNYVIYEVESVLENSSSEQQSLVTLKLGAQPGQSLSLKLIDANSWINASEDLRFASTVSATGMLLSDTSSKGELDTARLLSMIEVLKKQGDEKTPHERKRALPLLQQAAQILARSSESEKE